jgi:hypothetical protein
LYFRIFSTSFLNVILSAELITLISMCVPFLLSLIMVPDCLSFDPPISEAVCLCLCVFYFYWKGYQLVHKTPNLGVTSLSLLAWFLSYGLPGLEGPTRDIYFPPA